MRKRIIEALRDDKSALFSNAELNKRAFVPRSQAQMHFPMKTEHYSDSFCSLVHAENVCWLPPRSPPSRNSKDNTIDEEQNEM